MIRMGHMVVIGQCFWHKGGFMFDADRVTSIMIDPVTQLPPDGGGDPDRARREPICPACCRQINELRRERGIHLMLDERDSLEQVT